MAKFQRKTYDEKTKDRIINAVRNGKAMADVCKAENVQPYQVFAWIGERTLKESLANPKASAAADNGDSPTVLELDTSALTDVDLARAIGEWWLKTHARPVHRRK